MRHGLLSFGIWTACPCDYLPTWSRDTCVSIGTFDYYIQVYNVLGFCALQFIVF